MFQFPSDTTGNIRSVKMGQLDEETLVLEPVGFFSHENLNYIETILAAVPQYPKVLVWSMEGLSSTRTPGYWIKLGNQSKALATRTLLVVHNPYPFLEEPLELVGLRDRLQLNIVRTLVEVTKADRMIPTVSWNTEATRGWNYTAWSSDTLIYWKRVSSLPDVLVVSIIGELALLNGEQLYEKCLAPNTPSPDLVCLDLSKVVLGDYREVFLLPLWKSAKLSNSKVDFIVISPPEALIKYWEIIQLGAIVDFTICSTSVEAGALIASLRENWPAGMRSET